MIDRRFIFSGVLISLPALAAIAVGCFFLYREVPEIVANEHRRVLAEYRAHALDLREGTVPGEIVERGSAKDWPVAGKMKPGVWGEWKIENGKWKMGTDPGKTGTDPEKTGTDPEMNGTVPDGMRLVWYGPGDRKAGVTRGVWVEEVKEIDYRSIIYLVSALVLLALVTSTAIGVRYSYTYAKRRDDFVAAVAHDLSTPLAGARMALDFGETDEAKLALGRLVRLVENIRDFLRLGGRRRAPEMKRVDLAELFREAYGAFARDYRDVWNGKPWAGDIPLEVIGSPRANADGTMTVQILWNLIGNDLKYAAPFGPVRARIAPGADGFVEFSLVDSGPGLSPRDRRHIFDRYFRATGALKSGKGGFGIGLSNAKEFAEAMGGRLEVTPSESGGSVFTLTLELAQ